MSERLLTIRGLRLQNDGAPGNRTYAIDIGAFDVDRGDLVFVLGNRGDGKSALRSALKAIFAHQSTSGQNVMVPQTHDMNKPTIQISFFQRKIGVAFKELSGDPNLFGI